ncbi:FAD-binding oxidoreductase [Sphingomonas sp. 1P06PA]|uniref:FAD-binding oxidoreductase n=1 Tax=Sphingomonas sp. 1P06PA TaxID=554121 RepID=UPI0039A4D6B0
MIDEKLLDKLENRLGPRGFTRDPDAIRPWLTDWRGARTGASAALLSPADPAEVQAIVALAGAAGVPLVPQGGNTSMVAGATPPADGSALLVSLRRMDAIRSLSAGDGMIVAEAGAILSNVHDAAAVQGWRFPLSLGAKGSATIGGLVSTNAGGTQVLRFGTMRQLLLGIEAVLPDGSLFEGLAPLRKDNRGYDLRQLLAGAEGTLGIVTAAALRLVPAIGARGVGWAGLADPANALRLLRALEARLGDAIESFELVPGDALDLVLHHVPGTRAPLVGRHAWHVLIEATSARADSGIEAALGDALAAALEDGVVEDATVAASEAQAAALWRIREAVPEAERADGSSVKHDVSVAVAAMPGFILSARAAVEARFTGARVIAFGHLGDGNVHFNVRPPAGPDGAAWIAAHGPAVNGFVHDLVGQAGGSLSAEHGIGQTRLAEFARVGGAARLAALAAIKTAIDPRGIMNPGKLVPLAPYRAAQ